MNLLELKTAIDRCVERAGALNPEVEFWVGETEIYLEEIGQFGVVPDVVFLLESDS